MRWLSLRIPRAARSGGAVCECDGKPLAPIAATAIASHR